MSRQALTPTNTPALASNPAIPSPRTGDLYYNTSTGLTVYNGTAWVAVNAASTLTEIDAGVFDSIAPYDGGQPSTTATQSFDGGTP